jgi:hypothetical protein
VDKEGTGGMSVIRKAMYVGMLMNSEGSRDCL